MHQKSVLYIGNYLLGKQHNPSYMMSLGKKLESAGIQMRYASSYVNKVLRLCHMMTNVFRFGHKSDVVLIDTYSTQNFWYAVVISSICRLMKVPYIPILHGGNLPDRLSKNPGISKRLFGKGIMNISPSEYIKKNFEEHGFKNIRLIPNALDLDNYPVRVKTNNPIKILWVRSLSKIYNPIMALEALLYVKNKGFHAELCMVGPDKDSMKADLETFIDKNELHVNFTGKLTKSEWIKLASDYNVFINTSNFDNMPVSVIEAMALGFPVISTEVGGIPYLIKDGINGRLVPKNDSEGMAKAIIEITSNTPEFRRLSIEARRTAERFDWSRVLPMWLNVLDNIPAG